MIANKQIDIKELKKSLEECIKNCLKGETAMMSLPDRKDYEKSIRYCIDCAEICSLTLSFLKRKSPFIINLLHLCDTLCLECSVECDMFSDDIEECGQAADACRQCSEACDWISKDAMQLV